MLNNDLLLTDLYQLTMSKGYFDHQMNEIAVFEFFVRELPPERNFLIAAGLEQVLVFLENLKLSESEYHWLKQSGHFDDAFIDHLAEWRFRGDVYAMPEGTVFFHDEPILSVSAPLPQAQLIESRLINLLQYQTLVASKAARCILAAPGKTLVDFGLRRTHGAEAGLLAARASYLTGFAATSTVQAGQTFDIPLSGTVTHSFIQAHDNETQALENFARSVAKDITLLIDTYDTEAAAHQVVRLVPRLSSDHIQIKAVRLDSGDLAKHARAVRQIFDDAGLNQIQIVASGGIDEYQLQALEQAEAPINGFDVGTHLGTSSDAPYLDCAYKLTEYAGQGRRKQSEAKATLPGRKQVFRHFENNGDMRRDVITLHDDSRSGTPLLIQVMRNAERLQRPESLQTIRQRAAQQLDILPPNLKSLNEAAYYPVTVSRKMQEYADAVDEAMGIQS